LFAIFGLGNPGKEYSRNRHNAGFMFLDYLSDKYALEKFKKKDNFLYTFIEFGNKKEILIKPQTYMNLSGLSVVRAENFFKIERGKIVIIYDDVALPLSMIRVRERGSDGGHNGLKSVTQNLGTNDYARIRIGVGAPVSSEHLKNYVLGDFYDEDIAMLKSEIFPKVEDALKLLVSGEIKEAMNKFNEKNRAEI